jgi:hypothetical protein
MQTIWKLLFTLIGAVAGFFAAGFVAAFSLTSTLGARDGGPGMAGFFYFGPIGAVAGALLALSWVIRRYGTHSNWGAGLLIAGGLITFAGCILLAVVAFDDRDTSYSKVIEFELEYPIGILAGVTIPSSDAMWGAAGDDLDDTPISQFFEKRCNAATCVLSGAIAATGPTNNFRILTLINGHKQRYPIDLPVRIVNAMDWSAWHSSVGARIRWRIVNR